MPARFADQNLVPFQTAYPLLLCMVWLALAGNTGFVSALVLDFILLNPRSLYCACSSFIDTAAEWSLLDQSKALHVCPQNSLSALHQLTSPRQCRWVNYKFSPKGSKWRETLHFLLDHPRRCFIYLFPSRQTWFLLTVLIILK